MQGINDSIEVYQNLQEGQLLNFEEHEASYNISTLYTNKGRLYFNRGEFDAAASEIQKSIDILEKYNIPYTYINFQTMGDIEAAKGNVGKAISYYCEALENSVFLNAITISRDLNKILADYMFQNDTLLDKAKEYSREYTILNDSLNNQNSMVASAVLENIIKDKDKSWLRKERVFWYFAAGLVLISILLASFLIIRNKTHKRKMIKKNRQLVTRTEKIEGYCPIKVCKVNFY